jgi:putative addiction module antidote
MYHVKLTRLDNGLGLTLPADVLAKLGAKEGDELVLEEVGGGLRLKLSTPSAPSLERTIEKFDAAFRELAK